MRKVAEEGSGMWRCNFGSDSPPGGRADGKARRSHGFVEEKVCGTAWERCMCELGSVHGLTIDQIRLARTG